jgi:hypothetical protein
VSFVEQLLIPPKKKRRAKAKSKARLDRVDEVNVLSDTKPGIQHMGTYEAEVSHRTSNPQRRHGNIRPAGDQYAEGTAIST